MTASDVLSQLHARGAAVAIEGGDLLIKPARVLDDGLRAELRRLKPELLALLAAPDTTAATTAAATAAATAAPTFRNEPVTALQRLQNEAALCRVPWCHGLIRVNAHLLELWRRAERETGQALTITGKPRVTKPMVEPCTNGIAMHKEDSRACASWGFEDEYWDSCE